MATQFQKDQVVRVKAVTPQGPVRKLQMNEDTGEVSYLVEWVDADGDVQSRWFTESALEAV